MSSAMRRWTGALIAALLVVGGLFALPASAAGTDLGSLSFTPASGTADLPMNITTVSSGSAKGCPAGASNVVGTVVSGPPGWTNITIVSSTSSGVSSTDDFSVPMTDTWTGTAASNGLTIVAGTYTIRLTCQTRLGQVSGSFSAPIYFTSATAYQSTDPSNPATATSTAVVASPTSPQPVGTAVTLNATVTPNTAAGRVQFMDGATPIGTEQTVVSGHAAFTDTSLGVGSHGITAVFTPTDASAFLPSTSPASTYVITTSGPTATTTVVTADPASPSAEGTAVTFSAEVSPSAAAGTVQFKDGATNLGPAHTVASGSASVTTSALDVRTHSISAVFTPTDASAYGSSTATAIQYVVNADSATPTTTTLTADPASPVAAGTPVNLTATVSPVAAGTMTFFDGTDPIASGAVDGSGVDTEAVDLAAGSHALTARFVADDPSSFGGSTSTSHPYTVTSTGAQSTEVTLGASPASPVVAGQNVEFTATVTPAAEGAVQFKVDGNDLDTPKTVIGGLAKVDTTTLGVGAHTITADFAPTDPSAYEGSTSDPMDFVVQAAGAQPTSTALTSDPAAPVDAGTPVTFSATVTPASDGSVQFSDNGTPLGAAVTVSSGSATSPAITTLAAGTHSITAVFTPADTAAFEGSTGTLSFVVTSTGTGTSTVTSLTASPGSSAASGDSVTFTASVSPDAAGTIQFEDSGTALGTPQALVTGGQVTYSTSSLTAGSHTIASVFVPSDPTAFQGSTSPELPYTITGSGGGSLGSLTFLPPTGTSISPIQITTVSTGTTKGCPDGTTNVVARVDGPGWANVTAIGNTTQNVSTTADFPEPLSDTFDGLAQSNGLTIVAGRYDVTLTCQNRLGTTSYGTFVAPLYFTDATHYQTTDPSNTTVDTTTALAVSPSDRQDVGKAVTFTATVTPANASGVIQFKDLVNNVSVDLGAPVPVRNGTAEIRQGDLEFGLHTFSAAFIPADATKFTASASDAVVYVMAPPAPPRLVHAAVVVGSGRLGSVYACQATITGGLAYKVTWFNNGKQIPGAVRSHYTLRATDRFGFIACRMEATNTGGTTATTSRTYYSGLLEFRQVVSPVVWGEHRVGAVLIGVPGLWSPGVMFYHYQWLRDGRPISGAGQQLYRVTSADMGHRISVRVIVEAWFVYSAMANSRSL